MHRVRTLRTGALTAVVGVIAVVGLGAGASASASGTSAVAQVREVYRQVLSAEYFGPASAVCSRLTASGVRSYTAGGEPNCPAAFKSQQHILRHKTRGVDDSGYTPRQWRAEVNTVMAHLEVSVHGSRSSAIGLSGIPGRTTLVKVDGLWKFSSYPPSVEP